MASFPVCAKCSNHDDHTIQVLYSPKDDTLVVQCKRCGFSWISPSYETALRFKKKESDLADLPKVVTGSGNA